jgi:hypothetical protein
MRSADADTHKTESAIERSLWKEPLNPTLGKDGIKPLYNELSSGPAESTGLHRLPDEILLLIIFKLSPPTDKGCLLAFFALREVSRRFRRLMEGNEFLHHPFSYNDCCQWCSGGYKDQNTMLECPSQERHCFQHKVGASEVKGLGRLMRKNNTCKKCQERRDRRDSALDFITCKFQALYSHGWLRCSSCGVEHPVSCFTRKQLLKLSKRICIGKEGCIRLCRHKTLTWDGIKSRIDNGQPDEGRIFLGSCDDVPFFFS